jgi:hypothetical protein
LSLFRQGIKLREISRLLKLSRNTIRGVIRGHARQGHKRGSRYLELTPVVEGLFQKCKGNVIRVQEIIYEEYNQMIPYSSLTRMVRELQLRAGKKKARSGQYHFNPGEEMQHDTSPHNLTIGVKKVTAQCASLFLAFSRMIFIQYYPNFTRFEAKLFLSEAFKFMDGLCPRCVIDNTSVIVAQGSGANAVISPEMERFGQIFGFEFFCHEIGDADRKAGVERNFFYIQINFLPGRTFSDWHDLNSQARGWCIEVANRKVKRSLGMSPQSAYVTEKPHFLALPPYIPQIYQTFYRVVDIFGYVHVETNRYSVPERFVGKKVEIHKLWDRIEVFFKDQKIADHPRAIDKRDTRVTAKGHHPPINRHKARQEPCMEEKTLRGQSPFLEQYVEALKTHCRGRGVQKMRQLLNLKRTYPEDAFTKAIQDALHYGLYDLGRVEQMILSYVAGDFFNIEDDDE